MRRHGFDTHGHGRPVSAAKPAICVPPLQASRPCRFALIVRRIIDSARKSLLLEHSCERWQRRLRSPPSSLIARAASWTIVSSLSMTIRATSGCATAQSDDRCDAHALRRLRRQRPERGGIAEREAPGCRRDADTTSCLRWRPASRRSAAPPACMPFGRGLGRENRDARRAVGEERHEVRGRRGIAQVAKHLRCLRANFRVAVSQESVSAAPHALYRLSPFARAAPYPRCRASAPACSRDLRRGSERLHFAAAHEFELSLLANAHVDVSEQPRQLGDRAARRTCRR